MKNSELKKTLKKHGWGWSDRSQGYVSSDPRRAYDVIRIESGRAILSRNDNYDHFA